MSTYFRGETVMKVVGRCSDCDDADPTVNPSASEQCADGVDNDCDDWIDLDDGDCYVPPTACEDGIDNDGDGWTDLDDPGCANNPAVEDEGGYNLGYECNDAMDNEGDGTVDANDPDCGDGYDAEGVLDVDGDGWSPPDDCDDSDPTVNPGGYDDPCDAVDQDCVGGPASPISHDSCQCISGDVNWFDSCGDFEEILDCGGQGCNGCQCAGCGNGTCDVGETDCSCPEDCGYCSGCCDGDTCLGGNADDACGDNGDLCQDCGTYECDAGVCVPPDAEDCSDGIDNDGDGDVDCDDSDCSVNYYSTPSYPNYTDETGYYIVKATMSISGCSATITMKKGDDSPFSSDGVMYIKDADDSSINLASQSYSQNDSSVSESINLCTLMPSVPDEWGVWVLAKSQEAIDQGIVCVDHQDDPTGCYWAQRYVPFVPCAYGDGNICLQSLCE